MKNEKFIIKYTLRTNGEKWYLIDTKGNVKGELSNAQVTNLLNE